MLLHSDVLAASTAGLDLPLDELLAVRFQDAPGAPLHQDPWCAELDCFSPPPQVTVPLSRSLEGACSACDGSSLLVHPSPAVTDSLEVLLHAHGLLASRPANTSPHATAARLEALVRLRSRLEDEEVLPEVADAHSCVLDAIVLECAALRSRLLSSQDSLLRWVAAELITSEGDPARWPDRVRLAVTDPDGVPDRSLCSQVVGLWRRTRSGRVRPREVDRVLTRLTSVLASRGPAPDPAGLAGDLPALFEALDQELDALLALGDPTFLVAFPAVPVDLASLAVVRTYGDGLVFVAPELVGRWATSLTSTRGVQVVRTPPPSEAVLETVRSLFDPHSDGVLASLSDALAASRAVCAR